MTAATALSPASSAFGTYNAASTGKASRASMMAAAKEFEAVFMSQMIKPMWEGIETDGMFGGGHGEEVMRDMLVQEYGKAMVQGQDYGLSGPVLEVMMRMQDNGKG